MNRLEEAASRATAAQIPTVCLLDDDESVLRATSRLLEVCGYRVRAFASPTLFFAREKTHGPGCVLVDLQLPEMNGLEVQEMARQKGDTMPIVFISGEASVPDSVRALKAGALDFLVKPVAAERLRNTVAQAVELHRARLAESERKAVLRRRYKALTPREREVCLWVARGLLNKQIAGELGIAERTIKTHRARVMTKLSVDSVADLVRFLNGLDD